MDIEIINELLVINIYGFSGVATSTEYAQLGFTLMDKMWQIVKTEQLKNKGKNIWIYEADNELFAGVELL